MPVPFITDNYREFLDVPTNWYPAADQDKGVVLMGSEGLTTLVTPYAGQVRAFRDMGDYLYAIVGSGFYQIDSSWTATLKGNIRSNSGPAWIETNGTQVAMVGKSNLHVYTPADDTFELVTTTGEPGASCLTYQDGFGCFINPNTQQFFITASYDFTSVDALDYASAEGWPDLLTAIIMAYRELWLIGPETTEFWENTGDTFPFSRIGGHGMIHQGSNAPGTVRRFDNGIVYLNHNREVVKFTGYQPKVISTPKMTREIEAYASVTDAVSFDYSIRGHNFYGIVFPSGNATWLYDALTQAWHKRQSYITDDVNLGRWRGNCTYYWNETVLVGDYENGKIYAMNPEYLDEDGNEIVRDLYSQELRQDGSPIFFNGLQILFNHGDAAAGVTPQAMLRWTDDGGRTWSNELWRNAGLMGEYNKRCRWLKLGRAKDSRAFHLRATSSCKWDVLSVDVIK